MQNHLGSKQDTQHSAITLSKQLGFLKDIIKKSNEFVKITLLSVLLLTILFATAYGQVTLNQWNVPFYNAIENRNISEFIRQLKIFLIIASGLLILNVSQSWLQQTLSNMLRKAIVKDLIDLWLSGNNAYKLSKSDIYTQNPDQRIHQDTRQLADSTTGLIIGFIQSTILLFSFIGILWNVSAGFTFEYAGRAFSIPGYMVWAAILYVGIASALSQLVGRNLIKLNAEREAQEAKFRSALVTVIDQESDQSTQSDGYTKIKYLRSKFQTLYDSIKKLILMQTNLSWISSGFGWLAIIVPILIAAPMYFSGKLTFGGLMMTVGAFNQVYSALRWYINNYLAIAEWRAHLLRIMGFRAALEQL